MYIEMSLCLQDMVCVCIERVDIFGFIGKTVGDCVFVGGSDLGSGIAGEMYLHPVGKRLLYRPLYRAGNWIERSESETNIYLDIFHSYRNYLYRFFRKTPKIVATKQYSLVSYNHMAYTKHLPPAPTFRRHLCPSRIKSFCCIISSTDP